MNKNQPFLRTLNGFLTICYYCTIIIITISLTSSSIFCLAFSPLPSTTTTFTITTSSTTSCLLGRITTTCPRTVRVKNRFLFSSHQTHKRAMSSPITSTTTSMSLSNHDSNNPPPPPHHRPQHIVIAGAGIIGTSTAYYLSKLSQQPLQQPLKITLVDPTGSIAPAASGKAGGFLALDWNDYSPHALGPLARRGFELHSILAQELGQERIMYRRLSCACISVAEKATDDDDDDKREKRSSGKKLEGIAQQEWQDYENANVLGVKSLGDEKTIAQVHPKMLCCAMWEEIMKNNSNVKAQLVKGRVVHAKPRKRMDHDDNKNDSNYHYLWNVQLEDGTVLPADAILFACGPWTTVGNCMTGVKYHSVIIPTRPKVLTQSIFYNGFGDPEVYPRPDGTAYCCGFPDAPVVVQEEPGREEVRQEKVKEILYAVRAASGSGSSSSDGGQGGGRGVLGQEPELVQSCYLPCTPDNIPMMGKVMVSMDETDEDGSDSALVDGCYVAAGHGCWGILMGPATGEAMANLILTGESSKYVNLAPFSPERFQ